MFPPGSGPETTLPITVVDGNDEPVASGTLELAGQRIKVSDGKASILYADFTKGRHSVPLWLYRPNMPPIPGGLTFA